MWKSTPSDLSRSSYVREMEMKQAQCRNLVNQAERMRYAKGGPSREEGLLYTQAADICEEIMNMNLSQRSVYTQWQQRMRMYDDEATAITKALAPNQVMTQTAPPAVDPVLMPSEPVRTSVKPAAPVAQQDSTNSGFTTRNACKDVPASTIEKWYKEKPHHGFEAVTGMDKLKKRLQDDIASMGWDRIDKALNIDSVQSYLFYGPPGSGKTFLIEAFAKELMDKGFKYMKLVGGDIHASLVGVAEKTVKIAFQEAKDNAPCIVFIDEQDGVCADRDDPSVSPSDKRLTNAFLEAWNDLKEYGKNIIFIGATNYPGHIDSAYLDRTVLVKAPLPSEEERRAYFHSKFDTFTLEEGFTIDGIVDETENYNYRDMDRVTKAINQAIKGNVIDDHQVRDENGRVNQEQTDIAGSDAIRAGEVVLTYDLFAQKKKENPPSDKSRIMASLRAFEKRSSGE